jgi:hypothetical protein
MDGMIPRMLIVEQSFPRHELSDIPGAVAAQLRGAAFASKVPAGARIAIGVGSRGIRKIDVIARAAADFWKAQGARPFIFPAMGSHGAATAEGQADVLAHYGITEAAVGCPIRSSLEVVPLTPTPDGIPTYLDRNAFESDGVMLISRVKWHTDFDGKLESGLFKMMAIGLGKLAGAQNYHTYAYNLGLEHVIRTVGREVLRSGKILGGLAVLEDAYHHTGQVTAVDAARMEQDEEQLLALVKTWMGRIPADLDILIVDQIGKDISGAGMDTKVVNRICSGQYNPWPNTPRIQRIYVRGLSAETYGNACGIGLADMIHDRVLAQIDLTPTYVNVLTASALAAARIPLHFPSDRECIERLMPTVGKRNLADVRIGWIRDTLELTPMAASENMRPDLERNPVVTKIGAPFEMPFDAAGNLSPVFEPQRVAAD